tara:strand:+ start:3311 stop:6037 length:2727 start_codon:yes stop_codon:yes gene_type:complete
MPVIIIFHLPHRMMKNAIPTRLLVMLALLLPCQLLADEAEDHFESRIRPLLKKSCFECHQAKRKGGLRLDSRKDMLIGGKSGPAIVPGDPDKSLLFQAVSRTHPRLKMPPGEPLESRQVEDLARWIRDGAPWPESRVEFFQKQIFPVLKKECFSCHDTASRKGGLRVDSRQFLVTGGKSGPAIVPGDPEKSLLIQAIRHQYEKLKMPPKKQLPQSTIDKFSQWIRNGADWIERPQDAADYVITDEQRQFWSFQPLAHPEPPRVRGLKDANPVDRFVVARLKEQGLVQGRQADPRTLIRRATYDLIGLPPTPEEVQDFLASWSRDRDAAMAQLVDRLLDSPHYGERWGRHWLDLARYADTAGDASDFPIPEAYKYRNYVIDSFNNDKPYDQFIREQLAGDLLPFETDDQRWEQTIGTGFIAISRRIGVSPQNLGHITIEDTIDSIGKTFLGLTVSCARCHDHKFDPIPTSDYYALYGILDSSIYPHVGAEHQPWRSDFVYRIGQEKSNELLEPYRDVLQVWNDRERAKLEEYRDFQRKKITDPGKTREKAWAAVVAMREERRSHAEAFPDLEIAYAIQEGEPRDASIQLGGSTDKNAQGATVRRGFLQILGGEKLPEDAVGSGRRELADWIADPDNPLTARVMVNRIWHYHFGRGLVGTTSDFGVRGTLPTHPQLLDFLASYFIDEGWSIKQMHRLMMLSRTYQLSSRDIPASSKLDPTNQFLWRANRLRLDAEQIRDSILAFSGQLDLTPGGRHPFGHRLTYFYRQHEPFVGDYPTRRRSIYMMQQRIKKNDQLDLFDGSDGNIPLGERKSTTTTLQALFLMNSEFSHQQAVGIAGRMPDLSAELATRVNWAYELIFSRLATVEEIDRAAVYLEEVRTFQGQDADWQEEAWAGYLRGMISSNEFLFVD